MFLLNKFCFVSRKDFSTEIINAESCRHCFCGSLTVSGQHHYSGESRIMQLSDSFGRIFLHRVLNEYYSSQFASDCHVQMRVLLRQCIEF